MTDIRKMQIMIRELIERLGGIDNVRALAKIACPLTQEQLAAAARAVAPQHEPEMRKTRHE